MTFTSPITEVIDIRITSLYFFSEIFVIFCFIIAGVNPQLLENKQLMQFVQMINESINRTLGFGSFDSLFLSSQNYEKPNNLQHLWKQQRRFAYMVPGKRIYNCFCLLARILITTTSNIKFASAYFLLHNQFPQMIRNLI